MTSYTRKPTQEEKILSLLRERGSLGVKAWEITGDLHIMQYNARIFGLRQKGYNIVNVEPGHFVLEEKTHEEKYQTYARPNEQIQQGRFFYSEDL